jgi:hypothetical protein
MRRSRPLPALVNAYSGISHAQAECLDCGWTNFNRKNALATGSVHARRTGHMVSVEQVVGVTYNRRELGPDGRATPLQEAL